MGFTTTLIRKLDQSIFKVRIATDKRKQKTKIDLCDTIGRGQTSFEFGFSECRRHCAEEKIQ